MGDLDGLLSEVAKRLEPEVQSRLRGMLGGFLRAYLPQTWVFATGKETASLTVDEGGRAKVEARALPHPDVTVEIPADRLKAALASRAKSPDVAADAKVTTHTAKGKAAFGYLRGRLGL